ncbi:NADPH-dependent F420 reductase [Gluconobacter wancherniae]|uniref:NADP oxidoreductase n=1 Tax=Gluconobacter wancherniae NBRC 103581 TaxID=656744 RepID=A0A511B2S5_9PROT|nr:NADPH-dependent F420 reductase [Gluconobacter wancherniae]MBF0854363.1 NADPH-dependent F420 reductase [Gluconobacter wancherniae]MBS1062759.1 NADPH-dependent F420 reductase [Gluconobacter wancherniae]MBS1094893.1 NADPH-dependent F420 reductase [Gluconobacter wancherniae]GBD57425.1 NADP oxidoreductase [Gluconobacter wancherniae NBRC 103581]GBR62634.1 oxidoreductase [Gluconobacter wancherniae NBRC 103581]
MNGFRLRRRPFLAVLAGLAATTGASPVSAQSRPTIGIIGAGNVGTTLGGLWVQAGYHVMVSSRTLSDAQAVATSLGPLASAGTPAQAAAFGSIVVLAVPYRAIPQLGRELGHALAGKIIIDPSNPYPFRDGSIANAARIDGAGATTQRYFPSSRVVRAFNSIDMTALRASAHRSGALLAVPLAGNDKDAVAETAALISAAGFDPVVTGGLDTARLFQPGSDGFELERDAAGLKQALHLPN